MADEVLPPMLRELAYEPLSFSPITATASGYHTHIEGGELGEGGRIVGGTEVALDELLDDLSAASVQKRISFYKDFISRLHSEDQGIERTTLNGDNWADYGVMEDRVARALYRWEKEQPHLNNPIFYVELLGRALDAPYAIQYASKDERYGHIIARLRATPDFLSVAKSNLGSSSEVIGRTARVSTEGLIDLVENVIAADAPEALKNDYDAAAGPALEALRNFASFCGGLSGGEWRLGRSLYQERLRVLSQIDMSVDELAVDLEAALDDAYRELIAAAKPVHRGIYGNQRPPSDMALMKDVLDVLGDENRLRSGDGLIDRFRGDIDEAKAFMQNQELVHFPPGAEMGVGTTPPHLRALIPVSGFLSPPLLHPGDGSTAWITPIPSGWSRARTLSQLREYNFFKLKIVGIEALSRYIRGVLTAQVPDERRRLIRNVDPNAAYWLGWTAYVTESAAGLGYQGDKEEFKLIRLKYKLERVAEALLEVRMHAMSMSEDEAKDLLRTKVFVDSIQADAIISDVRLSPTRLALSYLGAKEWLRVREFYQLETTDFSLSSFHGKALSAGAMPTSELGYLIANHRKMDE